MQLIGSRFHILAGFFEKDAIWIEAGRNLASARWLMEQLSRQNPGRYFLFSTKSKSIVDEIDASKRKAFREKSGATQRLIRPERKPKRRDVSAA